MEIQQLKYFISVVEEENVTRAAEKLHVAQPAVSQTIKRLEEDLGVKLFERTNRRLVINDAGRELYKTAVHMINQLDALPKKLQEIAHVTSRTITIDLQAASKCITDAIIKFREENPNIYFKLFQSDEPRRADVKITTGVDLPEDENTVYFREEMFLAVPRDWLEGHVKSTKLRDFEKHDFISLDSSIRYKQICDYYCHRANINPKIAFKSDNPQAVRDLISAGLGVGFWPQYSWGEVNEENVKLLRIDDFACARYIYFEDLTKGKNEAVQQFIEYFKNIKE